MSALLTTQGTELVELLRRACFYGQEKGVGEERVSLSYFGRAGEEGQAGNVGNGKESGEEDNPNVEKGVQEMVEMVKWFKTILEED